MDVLENTEAMCHAVVFDPARYSALPSSTVPLPGSLHQLNSKATSLLDIICMLHKP